MNIPKGFGKVERNRDLVSIEYLPNRGRAPLELTFIAF
jgi:hypothetical protein